MVDSTGIGGTGLSAAALGTGALALGGLGYLASQGPTQVSSIPGYAGAAQQVPGYQLQGAQLYGQGQELVSQGTQGLAAAQAGVLTPEQQAANAATTTAEENQARQLYASMGRDFNKDTSSISTQQQIDQNALVRAQAFINSNIQLAGQELNAGNALLGASFQESNAATQILLKEGDAQVQQNKQFSDSMSAAFKAIGTVFGAVIGGPVGAAVGGALGGAASSALDNSDAANEQRVSDIMSTVNNPLSQ